jgi:hypothetical protein
MRKMFGVVLALWICGGFAALGADYSLADGSTVSGEVVSADNNGVVFKTGPDTYSEKMPWTKFSQNGLKELAQNPKAQPFATPFIEPAPSQTAPPPIHLNNVPRLTQPAGGSLFGALFTSSVGVVMILLIYAANIFAGFEIATFRERPVGIGIALAAAVPIIGPIILLSMPRPPPPPPTEEEIAAAAAPVEQEPQRFTVPHAAAPAPSPSMPASRPAPAAPIPMPQEHIQIIAGGFSGEPPPKESSQTQVFQRGQFMFNRRFFETKFPGFFAIARPEADRGKTLLVKTPGALLTVERISRISANEIHFEVVQGGEWQEIMVPFADIQQIQLKQKA